MSDTFQDIWFSHEGKEVDLAGELGRDGPDMVSFALHSLGWIRLSQGRSDRDSPGAARRGAGMLHIELDPRAVGARAVHCLGDRLLSRAMAYAANGTAFAIRSHGAEGYRETEIDTSLAAMRHIEDVAMEAQSGIVPSTMISTSLDLHQLDRTGSGLDAFAVPFKIWRLTGGEANQQLFDAFVARGLFLGRTKILQENENHEVIVTHYGLGHVLWSTEQALSFVGRPIRAVPDGTLGLQVEEACRQALVTHQPLFEMCSGVILAFDGPRKCKWRRLTLPCTRPGRRSGAPDTLITITESERPAVSVT